MGGEGTINPSGDVEPRQVSLRAARVGQWVHGECIDVQAHQEENVGVPISRFD